MPTHNKHILVRPKDVCLFWENVLILGVLIKSGDSIQSEQNSYDLIFKKLAKTIQARKNKTFN